MIETHEIRETQDRRIELLNDARDYVVSARSRANWVALQMSALLLFLFSIYVAIRYLAPGSLAFAPVLAFSGLLAVLLPVIIWRMPRMGLYILVGCASVFMQVAAGFERDPTAYVPIFWNIGTIVEHYTGSGALGWLHINIGESIMLMTVLFWLIRQIALRELKIEKGVLYNWLALYIAWCGWGFIQGMTHGGIIYFALTEVRAQAYFFLAYLMAVNLIKDRKQAMTILWIMIVGIGIKSIIGTVNYAKNPEVTADEGVLSHEDSLLVNILLFGALIFWLGNAGKIKWAFLLTVPTCLITLMANGRRAGIASFVVAFPVVLMMSYTLLRERRKVITKFILVFGVLTAIYLPLAWNGHGPWALPARAIRSRTAPDERDAGSDAYRLAENADLKFTRDLNPVSAMFGYGYGRPYIAVYDLPGRDDPFKFFLPHNGILWIWMRLGHVGFIIFWMFVFTTFIKAPQTLKAIRDPRLQSIGILAVATLLMLIINGEFDLSFANYRPMILAGTLLGLLGGMPLMIENKQRERAAKGLGRAGQGDADDLDVREVGAVDEKDALTAWETPTGEKQEADWERGVKW